MQLRHFIVGEIHYAITAVAQLGDNLFSLLQPLTDAYADKNTGIFRVGKTVVKFGDHTPAKQLAEFEKAPLFFRNGHRQ
ncbi:Uncharacterised protein [Salmonella enterica subsp. enterica serovar Bovismorbificans]|uniref:Uncharacterized protein n=1 Tax=Salmonella enterica subsp. enterica serovar Bovismorbificans TaxID=58097 RepID=A0A655CBQ3_SALET|nr:Uncharacterised protein [Salmonella enterica subsp. enterica serovar Bovismorbificans]